MEIQVEHLFIEHLSCFVLKLPPAAASKLCASITASVAKHPGKVSSFLNWLTIRQDQRAPTKTYWQLWGHISENFIQSFSAKYQDDSRGQTYGYERERNELLGNLFLNLHWGDEARNWTPLQGEADRVRGLFDKLPPNRTATRFYTRLLKSVGATSLPDALVDVSKKLAQSSPSKLFSADAVWYLETILTRLISGGDRRVRSEIELRQHTLQLLDGLVAAGSSVAYKLRDDFVTPSSAGTCVQ